MSTTSWNPADKHVDIALSNFNRTATSSGATGSCARATSSKSTGKWYFEVQLSTGTPATGIGIGIGSNAFDLSLPLWDTGQVSWAIDHGGDFYDNGTSIATSTALADSDIVGIAVDLDNGYMWVYVNNALLNGSTDPPTVANADFTTLTGTVYPSISTVVGSNSLTGCWLDTDLNYTPPTGFSEWDAGAILPETLISSANATESTAHDGSLYHATIADSTANAEAAAPLIVRHMTIVSTADSSDTDVERRIAPELSTAAATATAIGSQETTETLVSQAEASATVTWTQASVDINTANATETVTTVRTAIESSSGGATATATGERTANITLIGNATASAAEQIVAVKTETNTSNATETVIGVRRVTATIVDSADATNTNPATNYVTVELASDATASETTGGALTATSTVVETVDAEAITRLPATAAPIFWTNSLTTAAALWDGLPFNSVIDDGDVVYGAGEDGIYAMRSGNDNGTAISSQVTWDLSDFGSPQKKRLFGLYVQGAAAGAFTVRVADTTGRYQYQTSTPGDRHARQYRAIPGRGLASVHYRLSLIQNKWFEVDRVLVEHEQIARRV